MVMGIRTHAFLVMLSLTSIQTKPFYSLCHESLRSCSQLALTVNYRDVNTPYTLLWNSAAKLLQICKLLVTSLWNVFEKQRNYNGKLYVFWLSNRVNLRQTRSLIQTVVAGETEQVCTWELPSTVMYGISINTVFRTLLIFRVWVWKKNCLFFTI